MAMTRYTYILTTRTGQAVGELHNASDKRLRVALSSIPTASFTLPIADQWARTLSNPDAEHLLKIYAHVEPTPRLVFHGPITDVETIYGTDGSVSVNAAGPLWNLTHRYAGTVPDLNGIVQGQTFEGWKRGEAARTLIEMANNEYLGNTGIMPFSNNSMGEGLYTATNIKFKQVAEWITELSLGGAIGGGFDFYVVPMEYYQGNIGQWRMGSTGGADNLHPSLRGRPLDASVSFELGKGTRNNLTSARQPVSRDGLANYVYHWPSESVAIQVRNNSASMNARGRHEAVITADITDNTYRGQLLDAHLSVRQNPRRILEITPAPEDGTGRVPRMWADYEVGDRVRVRVVEWGDVIIDANVRIYGVDIAIDENGTPSHTLTIIPG